MASHAPSGEAPAVPPAAMRALFGPASIAIVGASDGDWTKRALLANPGALGFQGDLLLVNPRRTEVGGMRCYPTLSALPRVPDAIALSVAAERTEAVLEEAAGLGVKAAVVFAGGFADAGPDGHALQDRLTALATRHGLALVGPNCQGVLSFATRTALYLQRIVEGYAPGRLAMVSQSGSLADALVNNSRGVAWSYLASTGNEAVVTASDVLSYVVEQQDCDGACVFLETIRKPGLFFAACARARALGKPVLVMKTGRTAGAQATALAHTGALASPERMVDAILAAHGVARFDTLEQLLSAAVLVQAGRIPAGRRIGAIAGSGGLVEVLHDSSAAVEVPAFAASTVQALDACTGPLVRKSNPLDFWPTDDIASNYPRMLAAIAADPAVDLVVEIKQARWTPTMPPPEFADNFAVDGEALARLTAKPVVVVAPLGGDGVSHAAVRAAAEAGVALLSGIPDAMAAIGRLARSAAPAAAPSPTVPDAALEASLAGHPETFSGGGALDLMRDAGFDVVETVRAATVAEATAAAGRIGYPVVLKLGDDAILHKTEVGGVCVGLRDAAAVAAQAERLLRIGRTLLVQRTVAGPCAELILGLSTDATLGRFVVVGMGGVWTELFDDAVACPVGHLDRAGAERMLRSLKGYATLTGARSQKPLAVGSAVDAILRLEALARAVPRLRDLDVNPLFVTADRAWIVDALVSLPRETPGPSEPPPTNQNINKEEHRHG